MNIKAYETTDADFAAIRAANGGGAPKFELSTRLDDAGNDVPCLAFEFEDETIHDARLSECGRFTVSPRYYGLTEDEADMLAVMNDALKKHYYRIDVEALSREFSKNIRETLTASELAAVRHINKLNEGEPTCATHDFCDANMPMADAFETVTGREYLCGAESDADAINAAWAMSKARGFA